MEKFQCNCSWIFLVGKKKVFGPIWPNDGSSRSDKLEIGTGHFMTHDQWAEEYDCARIFEARDGHN